jgi:hypothetical protein
VRDRTYQPADEGALPFMISYNRPAAPTEADRAPITRLIRDLNHHLSHYDKSAGAGIFDREIPIGVPWKVRLARYLANSRVFVPLLSPPFFQSDWCGKEWWVFRQREVVARPPLGQEEPAVVPIIWVPIADREMHSDFRSLQYDNLHLPSSYRTEGLFALQMRDRNDDAYRMSVNHIAKRISDVLKYTTIEPGRIFDLDTVPNRFREVQGPNWNGVKFWHPDDETEEGLEDPPTGRTLRGQR